MSSAGSYGGSGGGGGVGNVKFLTGNSGGPVGPDLLGNINVVGTGDITVVDTPGSNTLTIELTGAIANVYDADSGNATPILGILNVNGGANIFTTASGNTIIIEVDGTTDHAVQVGNFSGSLDSLAVGTNGQVLIGATGADPAFATLTSSASTLTYTAGANTLNIDVTAPLNIAHGGTNATSMTNTDGVVYFDGTRLVTTTVGVATQVLTSNGPGVAPTFQAAGGGGGVTSITGDAGAALTGAITVTGGSSGAFYTGSGGNTLTTTFTKLVMSDTTSTTGYIQIGSQKVLACWGGVANNNIFVGQGAGHTTVSGTDNDALGALAMAGITSGTFNVAIGSSAMQSTTTSSSNVAVGLNVLGSLTTGGGNNTAIGFVALGNLTTGDNNIAIGSTAGDGYTTTETSNIAIGAQGTTGESHAIRIGTQGSGSGQQNTCNIAGIYGSTVGGTNAAVFIDSTGVLGTVGGSGGGGVTSITGDTGGALSGALTLTGGTSGAVFAGSGSTITESFNFLAMPDTNNPLTTGYISIGGVTVFAQYGGSGNANIFTGELCGNSAISGQNNTGNGAFALFHVSSGGNNTAMGTGAGGNITLGASNTAIGNNALSGISTGSTNIAIGDSSASNYSGSEGNNIIIATAGTTGESFTIRLGDFATQTSCYIAGIAGVTVSNSAAVLIDTTTGQLGTVPSSRRYKDNIHDLDSHDSQKLYDLRPVEFTYKKDESHQKQFGLIAEEVEEVMPYLVTCNKEGAPDTVRYHELPTLLLKEIQRLNDRITALEGKLAARVR